MAKVEITMTADFARPYQQVGHFGIWADETGDDYGKRDAVAVIRGAVIECHDEDMRTREVFAALDGAEPTSLSSAAK